MKQTEICRYGAGGFWQMPAGEDCVAGWHMLTTEDQVRFTEHPCHVAGGIGSILKVGDVCHMFYCKFEDQYTPVKQWVHYAVSHDGMETWEEQTYWMLAASQAKDMGCSLVFEPLRNRVQYKSGIRLFEDGGKMFPYEVGMERPLNLTSSNKVHVELFIQDSILVAYFNDQLALSTRMFNYSGRNFGLFASDGKAKFENIKLYTQKELEL